MKIGVFFYSRTGHTAQAGEVVAAQLAEAGHEVEFKVLRPAEPVSLSADRVCLEEIPSIEAFDALVLGTPVNGGRPSAPMRTFLESIPSLAGKSVAIYVTHFLPYKWGSDQTLSLMRALCEEKGGQVLGAGDILWSSLRRKKRTQKTAADFVDLFA